MSQAFSIELSGPALKAMPHIKNVVGLVNAMCRTMDRQNQLTVANIQQRHLSGPTGVHSLSVRSNTLRGSARATRTQFVGDGQTFSLASSIGSNVFYAEVHEFGKTIHHPSRTSTRRQRLARTRDSRGKFQPQQYGEINVTTKAYDVVMPERAPFRTGLAERLPEFGPALSNTVIKFWEGEQS